MAAGTENSSSFSLMPTLSWSPEACVTVYCVQPDGELISDTVHVATDQPNPVLYLLSYSLYLKDKVLPTWCFQVSLKWSRETAHPGEQVLLTVTAAEPRFHLGVMVMGAHRDAPRADLSVRAKQVRWSVTFSPAWAFTEPAGLDVTYPSALLEDDTSISKTVTVACKGAGPKGF